jgi:hypothetical protein
MIMIKKHKIHTTKGAEHPMRHRVAAIQKIGRMNILQHQINNNNNDDELYYLTKCTVQWIP